MLLMGRIAIMWGQVDETFNSVLRWLLSVSPDIFESLLGNQMIGTRNNHLRALTTRLARACDRELALDAHRQMQEILPIRNAAMHGCWGYFVEDPTYSNLRSGTFNHQKPKVRFYVDDLPDLYERMVKLLNTLDDLLCLSIEGGAEIVKLDGKKIYFAPEPPDHRTRGLRTRPGDKVLLVESKSRGWKQG